MNFNVGLEHKRQNAMWYVPYRDKSKAASMEKNEKKMETIAHGKWKGERFAFLKITVVKGEDLPALDPIGTSDPYCILKIGKEERQTTIKYRTLNPLWNETYVFEIDRLPQIAFSGAASRKSAAPCIVPLCEMLYYLTIDVWDKDRLNRDDLMGRIMIPVAALPHGTVSRWYPLGRTSAGGQSKGRLLVNFTLKALQDDEEIPRWIANDILQQDCSRLVGFQLPIMTGNEIANFPGSSECVEMLLDDVLVEMSGHRGLGRIFITNFRLVIQCTTSDVTSVAGQTDLSMWVALNNINSVDKGYEEKVIQKTQAGKAGFSDVKTLIIKCTDFRTIRLTFIKGKIITKADSQPVLDVAENEIESEEEEESTARESFSYSTASKEKEDDSTSSESSDVDDLASEMDDLFMDSLMERESFVGIVHSGCVVRMMKIFWKRLRYITRNANIHPPSKSFVSSAGPEFLLNGWDVYDTQEEFERQKVNGFWRLSNINIDFTFSPSYPRRMYVPEKVSDALLAELGDFRSKARIPTLTWFNAENGSFVMRCSQPRTGALGRYCVEDETLVNEARNCNPKNSNLVIFDARSMLAAGGNRLKGKGTEDVNRYQNCKLLFLDIANIHAMRDSIDKLQAVCEGAPENKWLSQLESTQWLTHISNVLRGATLVAHYVSEKGASVLIHCSDGWDRTPQLAALAQVMLDPHYRTFDGFKVLVEKDWISFGHRFTDRLGDPTSPSQRSPVFLQFLECVWQIMQQFPQAFEFTSGYLLTIAEHINSGWFGNFLCNSIREREFNDVMRSTVSIWAHLDAVKPSMMNKWYRKTSETLLPVSNLRRLQFWHEYFLRFDEFNVVSASEVLDEMEQKNAPESAGNTVIWVPDERVKECHDCKQRFTGIRRRHHCRACGNIFCNGCTRQKLPLPYLGYNTPERVCDRCYISVSRFLAGDNEDEFEVISDPAMPDVSFTCM